MASLLRRPTLATCNCFRSPLVKRTAATFIPSDAANNFPLESLDKPDTKAYFSGSPEYNDTLTQLTEALSKTRKILFDRGLLTSYDAPPAKSLEELSLDSTPPPQAQNLRWLSHEQMTARLSGGKTIARLSLSQYRRLTTLLNSIRSLEKHVQIADSLGLPYSTGSLQEELSTLLQSFRKPTVMSLLSSNNTAKREKIDSQGRAYAVGRRKESSAQVWLVPSNEEIGQILINGESLSNYFASPVTRENVLRPFTLTGTLGKYNAFVLARGGGVSGQAGAARLGIAKALLAFEDGEEAKKSLRSGEYNAWTNIAELMIWAEDMLSRDPRMVERKKTGQPKARKKQSTS